MHERERTRSNDVNTTFILYYHITVSILIISEWCKYFVILAAIIMLVTLSVRTTDDAIVHTYVHAVVLSLLLSG